MKKIPVAVVILSYNTKKLLNQCLNSILPLSGLRIIVVDNNSNDGSLKLLKKKPVFLIESKKNLGFAVGNNLGIRQAIAEGIKYIMVLNSDTVVDKDFLSPLIKVLEENNHIGVVGPKIYFAPGYEFHRERYKKSERGKVIWSVGGEIDWKNVIASNRGVDEVDRGQYDQRIEVEFLSGCCFLAPVEVWEKANFFDERFFLYYEDADFCQKAKKIGLKVVCEPKSKIWHFNAGSSTVGGSLHDYFITRNRLLFGMKWAPWRAKAALVKESFKILKEGRPWQKRGVRDFYFYRFGRGSWQ